jgi:hypothetical protein
VRSLRQSNAKKKGQNNRYLAPQAGVSLLL